MDIISLDFETYWSQTHSLRKMSSIDYVNHPETEIISGAFKLNTAPVEVEFGEEDVGELIRSLPWDNAIAVAHNMSEFDAMILAWRFGVRPKLWACTMAMARPIHAKTTGLSLGALVEHYGIGVKDNTALVETKGKHLEDFTTADFRAMAKYNAEDTAQCFRLFGKLIPQTAYDELLLIDATIRMLVEPKFEVDRPLLVSTLEKERARKAGILDILARDMGDGATAADVKSVLNSTQKLKEFFEARGVTVPTKTSPTSGEQIPAMAKTDTAFAALMEHPDPVVGAAVEARLAIKSTILESRLDAFIKASDAHPQHRLPMPLKYCGADTTWRWSGWEYNPQNLNRVTPGSPKLSDALRMSLCAPKDHVIVVADQSGIELRVNMFLWRVPYAMDAFKEDPEADLYKPLAAEVLGVPEDNMPREIRQAGKAMHLGCGFGLGRSEVYVQTARQMAQIEVSLDDATAHIAGYRRKHPQVVKGWRTCHGALSTILQLAPDEEGRPIDPWGMITPVREGLRTPKGLIRYPGLKATVGEKGRISFTYGKHNTYIYAGKVDENIVQHLARHTVAEVMVEVFKKTRRWPQLMVHDELIYVVPKSEGADLLAVVHDEMRKPPSFWPELVTFSEGSIADRYGLAK